VPRTTAVFPCTAPGAFVSRSVPFYVRARFVSDVPVCLRCAKSLFPDGIRCADPTHCGIPHATRGRPQGKDLRGALEPLTAARRPCLWQVRVTKCASTCRLHEFCILYILYLALLCGFALSFAFVCLREWVKSRGVSGSGYPVLIRPVALGLRSVAQWWKAHLGGTRWVAAGGMALCATVRSILPQRIIARRATPLPAWGVASGGVEPLSLRGLFLRSC